MNGDVSGLLFNQELVEQTWTDVLDQDPMKTRRRDTRPIHLEAAS